MLLHPDGHPVPQRLLHDSATSFREFFALPEDGAREPYPRLTLATVPRTGSGQGHVDAARRSLAQADGGGASSRGAPTPVGRTAACARVTRCATLSGVGAGGVDNSDRHPGTGLCCRLFPPTVSSSSLTKITHSLTHPPRSLVGR